MRKNRKSDAGERKKGKQQDDPEKHEQFTQSKFDIFFIHKPFSGLYKGNRRQSEEIFTDFKKCTQTKLDVFNRYTLHCES